MCVILRLPPKTRGTVIGPAQNVPIGSTGPASRKPLFPRQLRWRSPSFQASIKAGDREQWRPQAEDLGRTLPGQQLGLAPSTAPFRPSPQRGDWKLLSESSQSQIVGPKRTVP